MPLLEDINSSQITKAERWNKLYRIIHHLFLKKEFIHVEDYKKMVKDMNARFDDLENKLNSELKKIQQGLASHTHPQLTTVGSAATQQTVGPVPPPSGSFYTAAQVKSNNVIIQNSEMQKADADWMATGEAKAPLADRMGAQETIANLTIKKDILSSTVGV